MNNIKPVRDFPEKIKNAEVQIDQTIDPGRLPDNYHNCNPGNKLLIKNRSDMKAIKCNENDRQPGPELHDPMCQKPDVPLVAAIKKPRSDSPEQHALKAGDMNKVIRDQAVTRDRITQS